MSDQIEIEFRAVITVQAADFDRLRGVTFYTAREVVENVIIGDAEEGSYDVDKIKVYVLKLIESEDDE